MVATTSAMLAKPTLRWCAALSGRHAAESARNMLPTISSRSGPRAAERCAGSERSKCMLARLRRDGDGVARARLDELHHPLGRPLHAVEDGLRVDAEPDDRDQQ